MLPGEVEYQTTPGAATDLLAGQQVVPPEQAGNANKRQRAAAVPIAQPPRAPSPIGWADQICAALPAAQLPALAEAIRAVKYRWERGSAAWARAACAPPSCAMVRACCVAMARYSICATYQPSAG
jgi:hypothetical protein